MYVVTNKGDVDLIRLVLLDPETGKEEAVESVNENLARRQIHRVSEAIQRHDERLGQTRRRALGARHVGL